MAINFGTRLTLTAAVPWVFSFVEVIFIIPKEMKPFTGSPLLDFYKQQLEVSFVPSLIDPFQLLKVCIYRHPLYTSVNTSCVLSERFSPWFLDSITQEPNSLASSKGKENQKGHRVVVQAIPMTTHSSGFHERVQIPFLLPHLTASMIKASYWNSLKKKKA